MTVTPDMARSPAAVEGDVQQRDVMSSVPRRYGIWAARSIWLTGITLALLIFCAAIPGRFTQLRTDYTGDLGLGFHRAGNGDVVLHPVPGGPADVAGVRTGDILVAVAGRPVSRSPDRNPIPTGEVQSLVPLTVRLPNGSQHTYRLQFEGAAVAALGGFHFTPDFIAVFGIAADILVVGIVLVIGLILVWRRREDSVTMLASLSLLMLAVATSVSVLVLSDAQDNLHPALDTWFALNIPLISWFLFVFPDGSFIPSWSRYVVAGLVLWATVAMAFPALFPWSMPAPVYFALVIGWPALAALAQIYRYVHMSGSVERQQTKWVVFGIIAAILGLGLLVSHLAFAPSTAGLADDTLFTLVLYPAGRSLQLLLPLSILFAVMRYRLWEIDTVISRTLVYAALTVCVVGLYSLVVGVSSLILRGRLDPLIAIIATGVVAVLFQPLRQILQRSVNRMLYGRRDEPYSVLAQLDRQLESILTPEAVLPTVVETIASALRLPYAAITLKPQGSSVASPATIAASVGQSTSSAVSIPLVYGSQPVGEMRLAPRAPGESFGAADQRLLADLARHAGIAAHAVQLAQELRAANDDLQRSRQAIIMAREEERRRLRRDLHDGLGAALTGLVFSMDAASNLLTVQPDATSHLLDEMKEQTQNAIADIRRLVYGLRPPVLDELGLVAALEDYIAQHDLQGVQVRLTAGGAIPPLPAATELALYRIALEALTNVFRHARATACMVRLTMSSPTLTLEVADDGVGLPASHRAGVGISAMRERAAELGGALEIERVDPHGTRVRAEFPLPAAGSASSPDGEL